MGGAQVGAVNDATAAYWNPAGLTAIKNDPQISLMHAEYFGGIGKYDYGTIAIPASNNKRTIALSVLRFAVDDIPNTLFLIEPDGTINYNNIQTFSSADYAFLLSMAQEIKSGREDRKISFGGNAKVIHRKVGQFATAWGFGIDAGIQMEAEKWHLGIVAKDLTTTFNAWAFSFTEREKEMLYLTNNEIPVKSTEMTAPRLIIGTGYKFRLSSALKLLAEANIDISFDGKRNTLLRSDPVSGDPKLGLELSYKDVFAVRGGINNFQQGLADGDTLNQKKVWIFQPSIGAGFKIQQLSIDYAFSNLANQSNPLFTHVFSLRFNLKKKEK